VNGYIYILTDTRNGKQYVGKHNGMKEYYWSSGLVPNRIANKHGHDVFTREILEDGITSEEFLNEREVFYIERYNTFKDGYNATSGGEGGNSWANHKTQEELTEISRIKSEKMKGRTFSQESIEKMKRSHKGKKLSEEHKRNISIAQMGIPGTPHTEETKRHLSELRKGVPNPKHSEYMTYNNPNAKPIMIDNIEYRSQNEAARQLGITSACVKGRLNSKNEKWSNWYRL